MATDAWAAHDGALLSTTHKDLCCWRTYVCPDCHFEFMVLYKDGVALRHVTVEIECPRGSDGQGLVDYGGPLCEGRIVTELPPRYRVVPAVRREPRQQRRTFPRPF